MKLWFQRISIPVLNESMIKQGTPAHSSGENPTAKGARGLQQVIFLFCALEMLDALITYFAVNLGLVWEGNYLVAQIAGSWTFILLKFTGAVLSGLVLQRLHAHFPKLSLAAAVSIAVFYGLVLAWNADMIIRVLLSR
jgi:hypothetical protein